MTLRIDSLQKYYGETLVLDGVSFTLNKGDVKVVIGPSGCGKSTLLRCINGFETAQKGQILLNGKNILSADTDWPSIRQHIGMVFQSYDLFPHMRVIENITFGPVKVQKRDKRQVVAEAEALLEKVGLIEKKEAYPRELSGGQKQRIALVRALCMKPEILLLDEITASLDPEMVKEVLDLVITIASQGTTMLIVTHEMSFARAIADEILFLESGRIIEAKPPHIFFDCPENPRVIKFLDSLEFKKPQPKPVDAAAR